MVKLRKWMVKTRTSQAELSRELGISRSLVSHWLAARRMPGRGRLKDLSRVTGIKLEDLL